MVGLLLALLVGSSADAADGPAAVSPPAAEAPAAAAPAAEASLSDADRAWAVASSRMLGAAGTIRERAWQLKQTTGAVAVDGRASRLSALAHDTRALAQAVASATLAVDVVEDAAAVGLEASPSDAASR